MREVHFEEVEEGKPITLETYEIESYAVQHSEKEGIIIPTHLRDATREELRKHPIERILLKEDGDNFEW